MFDIVPVAIADTRYQNKIEIDYVLDAIYHQRALVSAPSIIKGWQESRIGIMEYIKNNEGENPVNGQEELMDRIAGCILGVFIGDALGVGVHWQYDLEKLEADRGFVTGYLDPLPGTYHSGTSDAPGRGKLRAGQLEQQGVIDKILLESLAHNKRLNQQDFLDRFEDVILKDPTMDGTREGGRYGWTDKSICEIYDCRITKQQPWSQCAPPRSDTPDAIVRAALIASLYFQTPREMSVQVELHAKSATLDSSVQAHSVAFASMIGAALQGVPLDHSMRDFLYQQPGRALPFSSLLSSKDYDPTYGHFTEPDSLLWFGSIAKGVKEFQKSLNPAHRGVLLYGQFCAFFASLPSAYYCVARFPETFEDAVLCSVNGGGQNTMRTSLVGALLGARVGLSNIPTRFLSELEDADYLVELAKQVAQVALSRESPNDVWFWPAQSDVNFTIGGSGYHPHIIHHHHRSSTRKNTDKIQGNIVSASTEWTPISHSLVALGVLFFLGLVGTATLVSPKRIFGGTRRKAQYTDIS